MTKKRSKLRSSRSSSMVPIHVGIPTCSITLPSLSMATRVGCKTLCRLPRQPWWRPRAGLKRFQPTGRGSRSEQNHRCLTRDKLAESLMNASKRFEPKFQVFQTAEAAKLQRDAAAAQMATANGTVELRGLEGGEGPQLEQQQQLDVSQAKADLHSANVDEYNIAGQIRLDTFSRHVSEQEVTIHSWDFWLGSP